MPEKATPVSPRISDLTRRLQREPRSRVFFELAREHHQSGNLEDAAKLCRDGLQRHPAYHSARVLLGRILIDMKQFSSAKPELERVMKQAPDNLLARRLLADALAGENDRHGALAILRGLLILNPADAEAEQRFQELSAGAEEKPAGKETLPGELTSKRLPPAEQVVEVEEPESRRAASAFGYPAPAAATPPPESVAVEPPPLSPASAIATVMMRPSDLPGALRGSGSAAASFGAMAGEASSGSSGTATVTMRPEDLPTVREIPPVSIASVEAAGGRSRAAGSAAATVMMRPDDLPATTVMTRAEPSPSAVDVPRVEASAKPPSVGKDAGAEITTESARDERNEPTLGALPTPTLAEIYLTQGMPERALEIYEQVLVGDPHNQEALARVREISGGPERVGDLSRRKIQVLEGWLERIRRHCHVQDDARRGGPKTAGV